MAAYAGSCGAAALLAAREGRGGRLLEQASRNKERSCARLLWVACDAWGNTETIM